MGKQGEINYLVNLREAEVAHAVFKPFSDANCGGYLMEIGAVMSLLPQPPARLLDAGCGTGWTSIFFAKRGYDVVGVDIAADMIAQANASKARERLANVCFRVWDYEEMSFETEFDCAVFYDALHHAVDEEAALRAVHKALKPGGMCVTSEPGTGHAASQPARAAIARFQVTEKDMPPWHIIQLSRQIGFRCATIFPHAAALHGAVYAHPRRPILARLAQKAFLFRKLIMLGYTARLLWQLKHQGVVFLVK